MTKLRNISTAGTIVLITALLNGVPVDPTIMTGLSKDGDFISIETDDTMELERTVDAQDYIYKKISFTILTMKLTPIENDLSQWKKLSEAIKAQARTTASVVFTYNVTIKHPEFTMNYYNGILNGPIMPNLGSERLGDLEYKFKFATANVI